MQSCVQPNSLMTISGKGLLSQKKEMSTHSYFFFFFFLGVCTLVCVGKVCVLCGCLTVAATGAAGTDWLHNLVCGLFLAPWMADSRPQTHTHWRRHT